MLENSLNNKVIIITGSASGIGKTCCEECVKRGAFVIGLDINQGYIKEVSEHFKKYEMDISNYNMVENVIKKINLQFGKIDVLINSAGINIQGSASELSVENWEKVISINLTGTFIMCTNILKIMEKQGEGVIINIASRLGKSVSEKNTAYCASKGGIIQLTKQMALDYAQKGIRINAVCPGIVNTPMISNGEKTFNYNLKQQKDMYPMKRFAEPEDVWGSVLFLMSKEASYITGACLNVDGGRSVT